MHEEGRMFNEFHLCYLHQPQRSHYFKPLFFVNNTCGFQKYQCFFYFVDFLNDFDNINNIGLYCLYNIGLVHNNTGRIYRMLIFYSAFVPDKKLLDKFFPFIFFFYQNKPRFLMLKKLIFTKCTRYSIL